MKTKISNEQFTVLINCIGAVETGGQVYGQRRYNDYTNAYANSSAEDSITIGAFQEFKQYAKALLVDIQKEYPDVFKKYDDANLASDLKKTSWSGYNPSKSSKKAKAIVNIISSTEGKKVQDERILKLLKEYIEYAESLGVENVDALFMCANFIHQGGNSACKRIVGKTKKPYTLDNLYAACKTDTGNQVGAYKTRQQKMYTWIKTYITNANKENNKTMTTEQAQNYVKKLLKHYPFVYCPTLAEKTNNKTPKRGDIVLFYKNSSGRYGHTGYVYKVSDTTFYTIEGNTSGASGVIANGGGVCKKSYRKADYPKTKFYRPDYSILVTNKIFKSSDAAIDAILSIAENEVGYLEKKSNSSLDSKTANAGENNYTKYWRDIMPSYQKQPWCACFVTWVMREAILKGKSVTTTATNTSTSTTTSTVLKKGSTGSAVKTMQKMLIACGFSCGSAGVDGDFGSGTYKAVCSFQEKYNLTKNGQYDSKTKAKLEEVYKKKLSSSYKAKVTADKLNCRKGAGTTYAVATVLSKGTEITITEEKNDWGKTSKGWVSLKYIKKV